MSEDKVIKPQIATATEKGKTSISINTHGQIISINVVDQPMYWYDEAWHPYPKGDKITIEDASNE